ncbi:MAG: hypothetical protein ACYDHP_02295 [Ferrimicrobium sp.]
MGLQRILIAIAYAKVWSNGMEGRRMDNETSVGEAYAQEINSLHIPDDAGEFAADLEAVLHRIPDGWGRSIWCERGWYPIAVDVDRQLAEIDPAYIVHQVKEKFGGLRYYFTPSDTASEPQVRKMRDVVARAKRKATGTCEVCGATADVDLRKGAHWQTACSTCASPAISNESNDI